MTPQELQSLCSLGTCNGVKTIEDGLRFEDKIYNGEDAIRIAEAGFKMSQIFPSSVLPTSRALGDESVGEDLVTIVGQMKPGAQRKIFTETYTPAVWQGELDGRLANACGFYPKSMKRIVENERFMCVKQVFVEDELCVPELLGSIRQSQLAPGSLGTLLAPDFLNQLVLNSFLEANHINVDRHAWSGDYGSPDDRVKHVDGFFKILYHAFGTSQGQKIEYTISGDLTDSAIVGMVGGEPFAIPFNTSSDTTVDNFVTYLTSLYQAQTDRKLFKAVTVVPTRKVVVEAFPGELVALNFVVSTSDNVTFDKCPDGSITACSPAEGVTVTVAELQVATYARSPIGLPVRAVTPQNVKQYLDEWYDTVNAVDPAQLEPGYGLKLYVARNIWNAYQRAETDKVNARSLGCDVKVKCMDFMGIPMIPINYMPNHHFLAARPQDLLLGTDLASDAVTFNTWINQKCDTISYKGSLTIGFQIGDVGKVSGTFCDPSGRYQSFGELMPCGYKKNFRYIPVAYVAD